MNSDTFTEPVKKKRGRKPLNKKEEPKEKVYKKRGRKPKNLEEPSVSAEQLVQNNEQVILHLPINSSGNLDNPTPYDDNSNYYNLNLNVLSNDEKNAGELLVENDKDERLFININSIADNTNNILEEIREQRQQEINYTNNSNEKYSFIFMDYLDTNSSKVWPSKSKIDCLWDCCPFDNQPFGIPVSKCGDTFTMFGNFCSAECASAYNFDNNNSYLSR